jgi:arylsulfatase A
MVVGTVRVYFLILALGLTAWAAERPNIILIVADDLGYGDVSAFGAQDIRTPHIDSLASDGVKLTSFYSAPLCTPSRAQMMLGQYPLRSGPVRVLYPKSKDGIDESEVTIGNALQDAGYTTAIIGKWHLGHLPQYCRPGTDSTPGWAFRTAMT